MASNRLDTFKTIFKNLYDSLISGAISEDLFYNYYIIQSVSDTKKKAKKIFNNGSLYITDVLSGKEDLTEFKLENIDENRDSRTSTNLLLDDLKNEFVDELITNTFKDSKDNTKSLITKLYILRFYRIAILDSICKNIQLFSKTLNTEKQTITEKLDTLESGATSATPKELQNSYSEILNVNLNDEGNSYIKYSYKLYIAALINYAISISIKESNFAEIIKQYIEKYLKSNNLQNIYDFISSNSGIEKSYKELEQPELEQQITITKYTEIIENSIVIGLQESNMFKETLTASEQATTEALEKLKEIDEIKQVMEADAEAEAEADAEAEQPEWLTEASDVLNTKAGERGEPEVAEAARKAEVAEAAAAAAAIIEKAAAQAEAAAAEAAAEAQVEEAPVEEAPAEPEAEAEAEPEAEAEAEPEAEAEAEPEAEAEAEAAAKPEADAAAAEPVEEAEAEAEAETEAEADADADAEPVDPESVKKELHNTYDKYKGLFHEINFLKLMTIVSYVDSYNKLKNMAMAIQDKPIEDKRGGGDIGAAFKDDAFIDYLFIDITELMDKLLQHTDDNFSINKYMERDTIIYNLHKKSDTPSTTKRIFVYMLSKILSKSADTDSARQMYEQRVKIIGKYSKKLLESFQFIKETYNNLIKSYTGSINDYYDNIVKQYNKIYSFVRVGQRSTDPNPRYTIDPTSYKNPPYLKLKYINIDKKNDELMLSNPNDKLEEYIFGKFDNIYAPTQTNEKISNDFFYKCLWNKNQTNQKGSLRNNICVIGLGQSGSGKTSSLISFKDSSNDNEIQDGILINVIKNKDFRNTYDTIQLTITEITLKDGANPEKIQDVKVDESYTTTDVCKSIKYVLESSRKWELQNQDDKQFISPEEKEAAKDIGQYIVHVMDKKRLIHPTPNNPVSSRSHMVICLTCSSSEPDTDIGKKSIIFLDLAGNENEFECEKQAVIMEFYNKYVFERNNNKSSTKLQQLFITNAPPPCSIDLGTHGMTDSSLEDYINLLTAQLKPLSDLQNETEFIAKINNFFKDTNITFNKQPYNLTEFLTNGRSTIYAAIFSEPQATPATANKASNTKNKAQNTSKNPNQNRKLYGEILTNIIALDEYWEPIAIAAVAKEAEVAKASAAKIQATTQAEVAKAEAALAKAKAIKIEVSLKNFNKILVYDINPTDTGRDNAINTTSYLNIKFDKDGKITNTGAFDIFYKFLILLIQKLNLTEINLEDPNFDNLKKVILEEIQRRQTKINCDIEKLKAIESACDIRKREGFMINRSIKDLIEEIKLFTRVDLKREDENSKIKYLPLYFETQIAEGCLVPLKDKELYDTFYNFEPIEEPYENSSIILKTIKDKNVNLQELNFVVFTVLNISDDANNPPNPPFININELIYTRHIEKIEGKEKEIRITTEYTKVLEKLKGYKYYYNDSKYISKIETIQGQGLVEKQADRLIQFISNVNQTTLIGTLESTDKLKHYIFDDVPCLIKEKPVDVPVAAGGRLRTSRRKKASVSTRKNKTQLYN